MCGVNLFFVVNLCRGWMMNVDIAPVSSSMLRSDRSFNRCSSLYGSSAERAASTKVSRPARSQRSGRCVGLELTHCSAVFVSISISIPISGYVRRWRATERRRKCFINWDMSVWAPNAHLEFCGLLSREGVQTVEDSGSSVFELVIPGICRSRVG